MNLHRTRLFLILCLAALLLGLPTAASAADDVQSKYNMMVVIVHPLVQIYEGDTVTLPYIVHDLKPAGGITLAPLTPGEAAATASLGTVTAAPDGLNGTITYTAQKAGQESIVLTVSNYFGTATGSIDLEIKPRPNYDLDFVAVSHDTNDSGGGFMVVFSGEGEFAFDEDTPPTGQGNSDAWFALWVENEAFACQLSPTVQGKSSFQITETSSPLAPLQIEGRSLKPFIIDLVFQPMAMNASNIACSGLGGISMNVPWPAYTANPDEYNLKAMYFPGEGGVVPIKAEKTWGYVWVERK